MHISILKIIGDGIEEKAQKILDHLCEKALLENLEYKRRRKYFMTKRCAWCCDNGINQKYHDEEWGIPLHDDKKHFEYLSMEVMQCGLNWTMMLQKRDIFRKCFSNFDYVQIAEYSEQDIDRILGVEGMIKSRRKIEAIIGNAKAYLQIIEEFGSFDEYIWSYSGGESLVYLKHHRGQWEVSNEISDKLSKDLKKKEDSNI